MQNDREVARSMSNFEQAVDKCLEERRKFLELWNKVESSYLSVILKLWWRMKHKLSKGGKK